MVVAWGDNAVVAGSREGSTSALVSKVETWVAVSLSLEVVDERQQNDIGRRVETVVAQSFLTTSGTLQLVSRNPDARPSSQADHTQYMATLVFFWAS
jgi:hypothetical protein